MEAPSRRLSLIPLPPTRFFEIWAFLGRYVVCVAKALLDGPYACEDAPGLIIFLIWSRWALGEVVLCLGMAIGCLYLFTAWHIVAAAYRGLFFIWLV